MFCPYCGTNLADVDGELTCENGVGFSIHMAERLTSVYIEGGTFEPEGAATIRWGGEWFCPGCGVATVEAGGFVRCPRCQRSLNRFLYELIEFNPHIPRSEVGRYRPPSAE